MNIKKYWLSISTLGVGYAASEDEKRRVTLVNQISFVLLLAILAITLLITVIAQAITPLLVFQPINIVLIFLILFCNARGYIRLAQILACNGPAINILCVSIYTKLEGFGFSLAFTIMPRLALIIMCLLPVFIFGYKHLKLTFLMMLVPLFCMLSFDIVHQLFGVSLAEAPYMPPRDYLILRGGVFILLIVFVPSLLVLQRLNAQYEAAIQKQKEEIEQQKNDLDKKTEQLNTTLLDLQDKNANITASITYAKRIQTAMLPTKEEIAQIFPKSFVFFRPRDIVSGDFYFFLNTDNQTFVAAADCTGHGVPGAFMSMIGHELLNEAILGKSITQTAQILDFLHLGIQKALKQHETQNADGMDIALVCLDKKTKGLAEKDFYRLNFSGAMNALYIVKKSLESTNLEEIKGDKTPIGGILYEQKKQDYTTHVFDLDLERYSYWFYMASDGYQDQFGGPQGRKFMSNRFKQLLLSTAELEALEQEEMFSAQLHEWLHTSTKKHKQIDDILVMGFGV
ncbi:MAG: hypothetical protein EAZ57_03925 [Cytophagales bacterium]|nr:MAG: hypothetical protein EAZ67_04940 [Cytophagales bacterium]TAF61359.1 MAG: hypothetical protein EAZ57_03925 [Cytophagales bacterium]